MRTSLPARHARAGEAVAAADRRLVHVLTDRLETAPERSAMLPFLRDRACDACRRSSKQTSPPPRSKSSATTWEQVPAPSPACSMTNSG